MLLLVTLLNAVVNTEARWRTINVFEPHVAALNDVRTPPVSHSQVKQDRTVAAMHPVPGYFVDLAANDATHLSNTLMLERDLGWSGLCVEANPQYWQGLSRRTCKLAGVAVGAVTGRTALFEFRYWAGGLVGPGYDNKNPRSKSAKNVTLVSLVDVFRRFSVPRTIGYFSLDVEGGEMDVMSTFPWDSHTIELMTVERPTHQLKSLLRKNNMVYLRNHGGFGDEMWCRADLAQSYRAVLASSPLAS